MKTFIKLLGLVFFISAAPVQAGLLVEPVLGLNVNHKVEDYSGLGAAFGGRLGYQNLGFQLGLDYLASSTDMDENALKGNFKSKDWAAFVGFEFPVLVRIYAGYIFSAEGDVKVLGGGTAKFEEGTGSKIGIGFTGLPFVDINVEYRTGSYDKVGGVNRKTDFSSTLLSLSLPLNL